jgi:N-acetylmuramic acid 6-phosphate (MurNAc-6-P) etherase
MVALGTGSAKLRARAVRNVVDLAGVSAGAARRLLEGSGWDVRAAIGAAGSRPKSASRSVSRSGVLR